MGQNISVGKTEELFEPHSPNEKTPPSRYREAIEIICECNRPRIVLSDFRFALRFLPQGAEHPMRQDESLDVGLLGDLSDHFSELYPSQNASI
jgi:hypothetical protein